jgi:hypothetical protein
LPPVLPPALRSRVEAQRDRAQAEAAPLALITSP